MKRYGRKINTTARYTEEDVRRLCMQNLRPTCEKLSKAVHEIHLMAFKDYIIQHCPRIDQTRAIIDYNALVEKYLDDREKGMFSDADVRRYNREPETNS